MKRGVVLPEDSDGSINNLRGVLSGAVIYDIVIEVNIMQITMVMGRNGLWGEK